MWYDETIARAVVVTVASRGNRGTGRSGGGWRPGPPRLPVQQRPVAIVRPRRRRHTWGRLKRRWVILVRWFLARPVRGWQRMFQHLLAREGAAAPEAAPSRVEGHP